MPIRMVDDPEDRGDSDYDDSQESYNNHNNAGGGGFFWQLLPWLIQLLFKQPLLLLLAGIVAAIWMFPKSCGSIQQPRNAQEQAFATGGNLDPKQYAKASIYEPLDESSNQLPEAVSLQKFAPTPLNQGQQGSCVAWSSAYAARTIVEAIATGVAPNTIAFSPSFLYNQIKLDGCQGSYILNAMQCLTKVGAVSLKDFAYDDADCNKMPDPSLIQLAEQYKMLGFTRLSKDESTKLVSIRAIKEHLAKDVPVVIGMMVGGSFMQEMSGKSVWYPTNDDYSQMGFGGHAMCVVGYDDRKDGVGAFQVMNSWGTNWGQNGFAWIKYADFKHFVREAYGLHPMPAKGKGLVNTISGTIGLVETNNKQYLALQRTSEHVFENPTAIKKKTTFKVAVQNNAPCYVYIVGKETDGSTYVLFPYPIAGEPNKTKFSPYCGITGYRLFPRGMSLQADDVGTQDQVAVIVGNKPINVFEVNNLLNQYKHIPFAKAVQMAVPSLSSNSKVLVADNGTVAFQMSAQQQTALAFVININKY